MVNYNSRHCSKVLIGSTNQTTYYKETDVKKMNSYSILLGDFAELDLNAGLARTNGDFDLYLMLLKRMCEKHKGVGAKLRSYVKSNDIIELKHLTHSLCGAAGNLGAVRLHDVTKRLLETIKQEQKDNLVTLIDELEMELEAVVEIAFS